MYILINGPPSNYNEENKFTPQNFEKIKQIIDRRVRLAPKKNDRSFPYPPQG